MRVYLVILLLILVYLLSFDFLRIRQIYCDLDKGNRHIEKSYYHLLRKKITEGTAHLIGNKNYHEYLQSIILSNLNEEILLLGKKWNASNSYHDYEGNLSDLLNRFSPLLLYLIPPNKTQQHILGAFQALTADNTFTYKVGYVENDTDPGKGPINFSALGGFALDMNNHSLGADLGGNKKVAALRLHSLNATYRIKSENLSLWYSNDNETFYKYRGPATIYLNEKNILIDRIEITSRYLKIHCNYKDDRYTFAENFNTILKIYSPPYFQNGLARNFF